MEGLRALGFHQKNINLCSEDERRSYVFESKTVGLDQHKWVINDIIFIFEWTIPLRSRLRSKAPTVPALAFVFWMTCAAHTDTPTVCRAYACALSCGAISWIPWQAQIREREESSRSEFVSTVQSPRIQVRAPGEHRRANILANISTRSGASVQVNEARVMPFSDSRERTEPASWARPSLSSTLNRPRTFLLLHSLYISVHGLYKVPQTFIFKPGLSFPTFRVIYWHVISFSR